MPIYATPTEMLQRYDARLLGELVQDAGTAISAAGLLTDTNLAAALADASSAIDVAVSVGDRYTPAQMADLSDTAAAFCRRLTCDLALIYVKRRRGRFDPEKDGALLEEVNATLKSLRDGDNLLLLQDETDSPASTIELVKPQLITVQRPNTIQNQTRNYFPAPRLAGRD